MESAATVVAMCGLAMAAAAQRNAINVMLSLDGGATWSDFESVGGTGQPVRISVGVFYERATGFGLWGSVHNIVLADTTALDEIVLLDRSDSVQHPDGRQGRFNFGGQRQQAYRDGSTVRIAAANNTQDAITGGISVRQNTPPRSGTLFDTSNPAYGFRFDMLIDTSPGWRVIDVTTPLSRVASFAVYATDQSTSGLNQDLGSLVLDGATIWVNVPAPASAALAAAIALRPRRRKSRD